jgi:antitoxin component of MazEF toxin-antitoxin module
LLASEPSPPLTYRAITTGMILLKRLVKLGNGVAILVPKSAQAALGWTRGDAVLVTTAEGCLIVHRASESELLRTLVPGIKAARRLREGV